MKRTKNYIRRSAAIRHLPRIKHKHNYSRVAGLSGNSIRWQCDSCPAMTPWDNDPTAVAMVRDLTISGLLDNGGDMADIFDRMGKAVQKVVKAFKALNVAMTLPVFKKLPMGDLKVSLDPTPNNTAWSVDADGFTPDEMPIPVTIPDSGIKSGQHRLASTPGLKGWIQHTSDDGFHSMCTIDNHDGCISDLPVPDQDDGRPVVKFHTDGCNLMTCDGGCLYEEDEASTIDTDHPHTDVAEPVNELEDAEDEGFDFDPAKKYTRDELNALLKHEIYTIAMELNVKGRSKMTRDGLTEAILVAQSDD